MHRLNKPLAVLLATATLTTSIASPAAAAFSTAGSPAALYATLSIDTENLIFNETQQSYFDTLSQAFTEAQNEDIITLAGDIDITDLGATLTGKSLTLDLNGHSITTFNDADRNIKVGHDATLTVRDSASGGTIATLAAFDEGTGYRGVIDVKGTFILESGTISSSVSRGILAYSYNEGIEDYVTSVIINGGTVIGADGYHGIQNAKGNATMLGNTYIEVNSGEVSSILSSYTGYPRTHDVAIHGGTVGDITIESSDLALDAGVVPKLTITDGIFNGTISVNTYDNVHTDETVNTYFNFSFIGGLYKEAPSAHFLAPGYVVDEINDDGYYAVLSQMVETALDALADVESLDPDTDQDAINALATTIAALDATELSTNEDVVAALKILDALFVAANPNITIVPTAPIISPDFGIEDDDHSDLDDDLDDDHSDLDDDLDDGLDADLDADLDSGLDADLDADLDSGLDSDLDADLDSDLDSDVADARTIDLDDLDGLDDLDDIANPHHLPTKEIAPKGLALALFGGIAPLEETDLFLSVTQENPLDEEDVRLSIVPQMQVGDEVSDITNSALAAPITFYVYLPDSFSETATQADIVHHLESGDTSTFTSPIFTDEEDHRYVRMTVTQFSTFTITADTIDDTTTDEGGGNTNGNSSGGSSSSSSYYSISITSEGAGTTSSTGTLRVLRGNSRTITFTPDEGHQVSDVLVNGESVGAVDSYTFSNVRSGQTLHVIFTGETVEDKGEPFTLPFTDVSEDDWFYDGVSFVYELGLMNGTSATTFSPDTTTSRGMIATILYRLSGEDSVSFDMTFTDVASDMYYYDAIRWAQAEGIVTGYSETIFAPNDDITREQLATILYRYASFADMELTQQYEPYDFNDSKLVSDWAAEAVVAMQVAGVINGKGNNLFDPIGNATRGEGATMLMRFLTQ